MELLSLLCVCVCVGGGMGTAMDMAVKPVWGNTMELHRGGGVGTASLGHGSEACGITPWSYTGEGREAPHWTWRCVMPAICYTVELLWGGGAPPWTRQ